MLSEEKEKYAAQQLAELVDSMLLDLSAGNTEKIPVQYRELIEEVKTTKLLREYFIETPAQLSLHFSEQLKIKLIKEITELPSKDKKFLKSHFYFLKNKFSQFAAAMIIFGIIFLPFITQKATQNQKRQLLLKYDNIFKISKKEREKRNYLMFALLRDSVYSEITMKQRKNSYREILLKKLRKNE